jgi:hypothetical protein
LEVLVTTDLVQPGLFVPKWLHHTVLVAETNCTCLLVAKVVFLKHDAARTLNVRSISLPAPLSPSLCLPTTRAYAITTLMSTPHLPETTRAVVARTRVLHTPKTAY